MGAFKVSTVGRANSKCMLKPRKARRAGKLLLAQATTHLAGMQEKGNGGNRTLRSGVLVLRRVARAARCKSSALQERRVARAARCKSGALQEQRVAKAARCNSGALQKRRVARAARCKSSALLLGATLTFFRRSQVVSELH